MKNPAEAVARTPAQRGQIIQRVLVDSWTCAEAAAAAGIPEQLVDAWVAAFRRPEPASVRTRHPLEQGSAGDYIQWRAAISPALERDVAARGPAAAFKNAG